LDAEVIERERDRLPERVFRQEYGGEFLEGSGSVFRYVRECANGEFQEPKPDKSYWAGLDLAKVDDFTVLVIMNDEREVVFVDRFHRLDWSVQVARIHAATSRFEDARILCDTTGAGEPVYESLREGGCYVKAYPFTQASKAALVNNLAQMLEQKDIVLPRSELWPEGVDELESFEYSVTDAGSVKTGAPYGVHDDCVVSLALAAWQARRRPEPFVAWVG
jgi:hypothetical protein